MNRSPERRDAGALPTSAFDYTLPPDLIAHHPAAERDASRLLVVDRRRDVFEHRTFRDIAGYIEPGDVLVLNETRVFPARLVGRRSGGGEAEIVLLRPEAEAEVDTGIRSAVAHAEHATPAPAPETPWPATWTALVRPGSRLRAGRRVRITDELEVEVLAVLDDGTRRVRLHTALPVREAIERFGRIPLPPYIDRSADETDRERYQTVFARSEGSVAAPTAGLHFTPGLLAAIAARGVEVSRIVLHVGVGTFRPVEVEDPAAHAMHAEWYEVTRAEADRMNVARRAGGRLWAVGTTVTRTLETVADEAGVIRAGSGWTRLFIRPGHTFRAVDRLITNFHLPRSTLLMLVSAFAGHERAMAAYRAAVEHRYRFYSYGDAMAIL